MLKLCEFATLPIEFPCVCSNYDPLGSSQLFPASKNPWKVVGYSHGWSQPEVNS